MDAIGFKITEQPYGTRESFQKRGWNVEFFGILSESGHRWFHSIRVDYVN